MSPTTLRRSGGHALLLAALCGGMLAGCSSSEETAPENVPTTATEHDDADDADHDTSVLDIDPGDAVDEATYEILGTENEVTVQILPLEVTGDVMIMRLVYTPHFEDADDDELISLYDMQTRTSKKFLPILVDRENLKEYSLISDTGQTWATDRAHQQTLPDRPIDWWGVFAAPQDDIDVVDVRLGENMPEFQDVPIR